MYYIPCIVRVLYTIIPDRGTCAFALQTRIYLVSILIQACLIIKHKPVRVCNETYICCHRNRCCHRNICQRLPRGPTGRQEPRNNVLRHRHHPSFWLLLGQEEWIEGEHRHPQCSPSARLQGLRSRRKQRQQIHEPKSWSSGEPEFSGGHEDVLQVGPFMGFVFLCIVLCKGVHYLDIIISKSLNIKVWSE